MACFIAARLAAAGININMLDAWAEGIYTIRENGITLINETGQSVIHVKTFLSGEIIPACDYGLVLVKTWQNEWAAQVIKENLNQNSVILTLQNGLGNSRILKQVSGINQIYSAVTTLGATLFAPGRVRGFDNGYIQVPEEPLLYELSSLFRQAGFNVVMDAAIEPIIWGKLLVNAVINPLTALLEVPNGKLLDFPELTPIILDLVEETLTLCRALNITLPYSDPMRHLSTVIHDTAANRSSMYQDILRGAPTEIEQINGEIIRLAMEHGISTPSHKIITGLVKTKAAKKMLEV
ncbi:MAG: 2-dehydropantoate 2-reductase [Anaerolineae bacterium]|nr:2-dehydropantoate 2-reductase [Anaerolineae bacterium]